MDKPQVSIPPAANVLGTIGTAAGVSRLFHRYGTTGDGSPPRGLPGSMLILWSICGVPFGVYAIVQNFNFALKFQPQAFAGLTLIAWGQTLYYQNKWRAWTATLATIALASSFALMEMILILTLRGPYSRGVQWPMMLMAISASVIQVIGLIPPYFELAKRNGRVIGINFWFLTIDYSGAFFSLMAVVAQQWFDALGASLYIACMLLETGIFASQALWLWRVRHVRAEAKKAGLSYDQYIAKHPTKKLPRSDSQETVVDVEACWERKDSVFDTTKAEKECAAADTAREEKPEMPQMPPAAVTRSDGSDKTDQPPSHPTARNDDDDGEKQRPKTPL